MAGGEYNEFETPKQLLKINNETLVERTIRLLKQNGITDIAISTNNPAFDYINVEKLRHKNEYVHDIDGKGQPVGCWLNAYYPTEEPACYLHGDVYFSEEAIKTIVENDTDSTLFFCTYNNESDKYVKHHDEPLAYKVVDTDLFKKHITKVKKMYDDGLCCRHPIVWEVYRSIHGIDVNTHIMTDNFIAINDISCDIDSLKDLENIKIKVDEVKMIRVEVIKKFDLARFDELKNIERKKKDVKGSLFVGDTFECTQDLVEYLTGGNRFNEAFVKVIEINPKK